MIATWADARSVAQTRCGQRPSDIVAVPATAAKRRFRSRRFQIVSGSNHAYSPDNQPLKPTSRNFSRTAVTCHNCSQLTILVFAF
jgi:hypothetical protein